MRYMAFDRPVLRRTNGLIFWRLLGTGRGPSMTLGADLRRWALLAVWRRADDLDDFLARSPVPARWRREAREHWQVRLAPVASRGTWGGTDPFAVAVRTARSAPSVHSPPSGHSPPSVRSVAGGPGHAGPVAVLTRASIRPARLAAFYGSITPVEDALRHQDGCVASVGIGEWPLARQATFSLWRDAAAVRDFAYHGAAHRQVIDRVRAEDWYAEEMFTRFVPYAPEGTWDGAEPLR